MALNQDADCLIAGGGPAGLMCGYLLARAGVRTIVLEKHADFLRDFRGDTIHPSTLQLMHELGMLDDLLELPHQDVGHAELDFGEQRVRVADFTHLPVEHQSIVFMPQASFLEFVSARAKRLSGFRLLMQTEVLSVISEGGRAVGLRVRDSNGERTIRAGSLVIAADGRDSRLRAQSNLRAKELGAPMDVMWFRLDFRPNEDHAVLGKFGAGRALIMLYRGDYWQCALIIPKGTSEKVRTEGLESFRRRVARLVKRDHVDEITDWSDVKLLTVEVNRLEKWHKPGLLFIGDAAHAMSPIGGVGINLAIQDAVAAANILADPLRNAQIDDSSLARVQHRRMFPSWATQRLQMLIQNQLIDPVLSGVDPGGAWPIRMLQAIPLLQRLLGRAIGLGFRPEHIASQTLKQPEPSPDFPPFSRES